MAVYRYTAILANREDRIETGTVAAHDEEEARKKLKRLDLNQVKLKELHGFSALIKRFTADVR